MIDFQSADCLTNLVTYVVSWGGFSERVCCRWRWLYDAGRRVLWRWCWSFELYRTVDP